MAARLQIDDPARRYRFVYVFADLLGGYDVVARLQDKGPGFYVRQVGPIVGREGSRANCLAISGSVRQKLFANSSPSYGRSGLPMMAGAIAADQPIWLSASEASSSSISAAAKPPT